MDERTLTALYDTKGAAASARDELIRLGVPEEGLSIRAADTGSTSGATEDRGFWGSLSDLFMPDSDRQTYAEGLRRGGSLLTAQVPAALEDEAITVLERSEPVDVDERRESWRESGWTGESGGYAASGGAGTGAVLAEDGAGYRAETASTATAGYGTTGTSAPATATSGGMGLSGAVAGDGHGTDEDRLQVVEEQLRVGKREVGRGSVRVRSYVTERPVEEQVELRQEHVSIERRPVNRELRADDPAFEERTIEVAERGEEAVVSKTAQVVEEIGIRRDVERETETVRDTVRRQDVEVEDGRAAAGIGVTDERRGSAVDPAGTVAPARGTGTP